MKKKIQTYTEFQSVNESSLYSTNGLIFYKKLVNTFGNLDLYIDRPEGQYQDSISISGKDRNLLKSNKKFKDILDNNNWYISKDKMGKIVIRPKLLKELEINNFKGDLFHVTPNKNIENEGIKPSSKNSRDKYPDRIYLFSSINHLKSVVSELKSWKNHSGNMYIFKISDLNSKLYKDTDTSFNTSYFTTRKIPSSKLKLIEVI